MKKLKKILNARRASKSDASPVGRAPQPKPLETVTQNTSQAHSPARSGTQQLELLPFEIRHHILLALASIEDLSALVHASPVFHEQYARRRGFWLWRYLQAQMGDGVIDAYTAALCSKPDFDCSRQNVQGFLAAYYSRRSGGAEELYKEAKAEDLAAMTRFYIGVVRPLIREYALFTLEEEAVLREVESSRVIRAMYRFQIFCSLFGLPRSDARPKFTQDEHLTLLSHFEPWETEEILCINDFADNTYERVFEEIDEFDFQPVKKSLSGLKQFLQSPPGILSLGVPVVRRGYKIGLAASGLTLLLSFLKTEEPEKKWQMFTAIKDTVFMDEDWVCEATSDAMQQRRRQTQPSDRDAAQDRREPMVFSHDTIDSPPLGWTLIWKETYSNIYGYYVPSSLRRWGYVMWDASRMGESGGIRVLHHMWKEHYGDEYHENVVDPRDNL
ncbi:unnamed protein product [Clonostachys chloroleuca]|uniref:F-box domain-containing protein n=1 Tax=Clonostachys chloroleuca TaxID=1926264 RepID=A0AA35QBH1_9HYPO|nr:unnamed protein product [Clonostachys chloroleuca]